MTEKRSKYAKASLNQAISNISQKNSNEKKYEFGLRTSILSKGNHLEIRWRISEKYIKYIYFNLITDIT